MAVQDLGGPWGLWSCRGQALVGQLGSRVSWLIRELKAQPPGVLAASPEAGTFTCVSFLQEPSPVDAPQVHSFLIRLSMVLPASHADLIILGLDWAHTQRLKGHRQCIP